MKVLLLGSGGREHTLAWKMAQSSLLEELLIAPGNPGTAEAGENINVSVDDFDSIKALVVERNVEMVVVGPEAPLVNGIRDYFERDESMSHIKIIGPDKKGAQLEGSKEFAKQFMERHQIPTAEYKCFTKQNLEAGYEFLEQINPPYVLKADGLAAGKGVVILDDLPAAKQELSAMLADAKFGSASERVVIEEYLDGIELSVFVLTDGVNYKILPEAKDYKRIGEGDTGPNTGGMGAISPVPFANEAFLQKVEQKIIQPTITGLQQENIDYRGFLFFGLMNVGGEPYMIEYNVRMGDPETEVVVPRIKSDLLEMFQACADQSLNRLDIKIDDRVAATVMLVSGGYPESYEKEKLISGLHNVHNSLVFHAGTKTKDDVILTSGGRVLALTSFGNSMEEALQHSYQSAELVNFEKMYYRKDLGFDLQQTPASSV